MEEMKVLDSVYSFAKATATSLKNMALLKSRSVSSSSILRNRWTASGKDVEG